ncbi:MAG TPA: hypothetical protein VGC41_19905 [Kofleriaceae bacterium]
MRKILLVVLVACKDPAPPPAPPPPRDLIVVAPGVLPQRVLRYVAAKGTKSNLEIEIESSLMAGSATSPAPRLVFSISLSVDDVTADGAMKVTATIQDLATHAMPDAPGAPRAGLDATAVKGMTITYTLAADGQQKDIAVSDRPLTEPAKTMVAQLAQQLPSLAMQLPPTPVGIGAKWRSSKPLKNAGLALQSVTTIDLVGLKDNQLTYEATSTVHGPDQTITEEGQSVSAKGITGQLKGHGTVDLGTLAQKTELDAELHVDMAIGSDDTPMTMKLNLKTH